MKSSFRGAMWMIVLSGSGILSAMGDSQVSAADWPQFLGPDRNGISSETGLLDAWPDDRQIMFCDEALVGAAETLTAASGHRWAIFIGPEGGFSDRERERLHAMDIAHPVSLGPRILRADTAAVAAIAAPWGP